MVQIDMKMPKSCLLCRFIYFNENESGNTICEIGDFALAKDYKGLDFDGRHKSCPLKDVEFIEDEIHLISNVFQAYYCMRISVIAKDNECAKSIFKKVRLLKDE